MSALKILIQHRQTKKFFKNRRTWTSDISQARDFPTALAAFYFAAEEELRDVEMVSRRLDAIPVNSIIERRSTRPARLGATAQ